MAISPAERRFLRSWEEQRNGGKASFVAIYTLAYTLVVFLSAIAAALFGSLPFIHKPWLIGMAVFSVLAAFVISQLMWKKNQKKWRGIIVREMEAAN